MQKSSKIILLVCGILLIYLVTVIYSYKSQSQPEFEQEDAAHMMTALGKAFMSSSTEGVLSFAAPDAKVAGRDLEEMRGLLQRAFRAMKNPQVDFSELTFSRTGLEANLRVKANVRDAGEGGYHPGEILYSAPMGFQVKRIETARLGGLLTTYEWKITDVDAPNVPFNGL